MKKLIMLAPLVAVAALFAFAQPAQAQGVFGACNEGGVSNTAICGDFSSGTGIIRTVIEVLFYIIGVLSVVFIIHSGLKYILSNGDATAVQAAKNTLLYAIIGLVVSVSAITIISFVVGRFQ